MRAALCQAVSVLWNCLAYFNSCVNPIIYNRTPTDSCDERVCPHAHLRSNHTSKLHAIIYNRTSKEFRDAFLEVCRCGRGAGRSGLEVLAALSWTSAAAVEVLAALSWRSAAAVELRVSANPSGRSCGHAASCRSRSTSVVTPAASARFIRRRRHCPFTRRPGCRCLQTPPPCARRRHPWPVPRTCRPYRIAASAPQSPNSRYRPPGILDSTLNNAIVNVRLRPRSAWCCPW